ncbi:MAG TPA: J domain-containing protein [Alphaproteobacteria bacterium]|jgi:DnaJ-class molecular chaperone|nr:J domain-containing protein [Micavibrio sp.]HQX27647.1 J domain-containing protein [Alphaproteobacteria bacterium]
MTPENLTTPVCYYDVLQVTPRSGDDEIKRAYRRLAMVYHPDMNPQNRMMAELRFRLINEAYAHLKTREKRLRYNLNQKARAAAGNDNRAVSPSWFEQFAAFFRAPREQNSGSKA